MNQIVGGDAKAQIFDKADDATSELVVEEPAVSEDFVQIDSNEEEVKADPCLTQEDSLTIELLKKDVSRAWKIVETAKEKEKRARSIISDLKAEIAHLNQIVGGDAKAQIFDKVDDVTSEQVVEEPAVSDDFVQIDSNAKEVKAALHLTQEDSSTISLL